MARTSLGLVVLALVASVACQTSPNTNDRKAAAASSDEFRALVYTNELAQRFQLPARDAVTLDPGVLGISIRVSRDPNLNWMCLLALYLDDSVPFAYPAGSQRHSGDSGPAGPLFFVNKLLERDAEVLTPRTADPRVLLVSRVYSEQDHKGFQDSGPVDSFYRDILPELNVVEYVPICSSLDPRFAPVDVWLLRAGHESQDIVSLVNGADPGIAVRVQLPQSLLRLAAPATQRAVRGPVNYKLAPPPSWVAPRGK